VNSFFSPLSRGSRSRSSLRVKCCPSFGQGGANIFGPPRGALWRKDVGQVKLCRTGSRFCHLLFVNTIFLNFLPRAFGTSSLFVGSRRVFSRKCPVGTMTRRHRDVAVSHGSPSEVSSPLSKRALHPIVGLGHAFSSQSRFAN